MYYIFLLFFFFPLDVANILNVYIEFIHCELSSLIFTTVFM